jgi:hypothetical protein
LKEFSMYSEYAELVSFKDLDEAILQIHCAYFDMKLLELREKHIAKTEGYWRAVTAFRRSKLDPFTPDHGRRQLPDKPLLTEQQLNEARQAFGNSVPYFTYQRGFVYWFDGRARFWAHSEADSIAALVKILVPSAALKRLEQQVSVLQTRIEQTDAFAAAPDHVKALARSSVVPPPDPATFGGDTAAPPQARKLVSDHRTSLLKLLFGGGPAVPPPPVGPLPGAPPLPTTGR